ncbi:hypothetical protein [Opitutus sp. ER46]|uniref:hypothetical protein n=1 Tax=Opitutus sp. ER46 TaxID=2161864 RepID=UPI000D30E6DF|nr:hypothetical protein [Opitutus sp. ER46]PTX98893.1 hypothetical protein DB354_02385 [Opitutus sp. ER46]
MDKVYKGSIPAHRKTLQSLKREFSQLPSKTNWARLRIDPLLKHVTNLDRLLNSPQFAQEHARLRQGVRMFHSDLVYLRDNIAALKKLLAEAQRRAEKRA